MKRGTLQSVLASIGGASLLCLLCISSPLFAADAPALPPGLEDKAPEDSPPALPEGLGATSDADTPPLPSGLDDAPPPAEEPPQAHDGIPPGLSGFLEGRAGLRTQNDPHEKTSSIGETRLQLQLERSFRRTSFNLTTDLIYDPVLDKHEIDLEKGEGFLDLREANMLLRPGRAVDLKVGRQILTWGTGDLIFINDLFPKDWNAFFIGRDTEYLKAPSDALKASLFSALVNLDIVYTPRFDADRFIDGQRISFYNGALARRSGRDAVVNADRHNDWFKDDELAWRLYKNVGGLELAVYGYDGYWKSPGGMDSASGAATFPKLSVYGASGRGALAKGIGNIELGLYNSRDDRDGNNAFVRNSEVRFLAGYEQEAAQNLTVGFQYYLEYMLEHDAYLSTLPAGSPVADEDRHVITLRLTHLLMQQNLRLSLFTFYSPSDQDAYLRPKAHYKIGDAWSAEFGGNVFVGKDRHTFFGQFENNSNVYLALRYSF